MKISKDQVDVIIKQGQSKGLTGQAVLDGLIKRGYEPEGIDVAAAKQEIMTREPKAPAPEKTFGQKVKDTAIAVGDFAIDAGKDVVEAGKDFAKNTEKRAANIGEIQAAMANGDQGKLRSLFQTVGQLAGAGADAIGTAFVGAGKVLLPEESEKAIGEVVKTFGAKVLANKDVQSAINFYHDLTPEQRRDVDAVGGIVSLASNFVGAGAASKGATAAKEGAIAATDAVGAGANAAIDATKAGMNSASKAISQTATKIADAGAESGIVQTGKELLERVPRALGRAADATAEASARAKRIKLATPAVKDAIKANLDDRIINTVSEADDATLKAYKDVLTIAEESPKKIGVKKQPTIVGGELAAQQFDLINKEKQAVGSQIGEAVKELSKTTTADLAPGFKKLEDVLGKNGIQTIVDEKGVKLDFSGSSFTPAERTRIQQLFDLANEGGSKITPEQIYNKNKLFSKLKREANFEGIGNIIVETEEGQKSSLFDVFRDTYSTALDEAAPSIRPLNKKYAQLSNLTDDIEGSIFKTPDFEVVKSVDPAEFAKVNLRRIFGESQSSPVFEGVADAMDAASRGLGYKGATPKAVAEFAQEMRKLFPEIIPKTGFTGGIKVGVGDIVEKISKAGTPGLADQQKALRKLLDSLTNK